MFTYLHKIEPYHVSLEKEFAEIWPEVAEKIEDCVLLAHNAEFDLGIINHMHEKYLKTNFSCNYICTLEFARKYLKYETHKFGLEHLCKHLDLPYGKHDGEKDTISCFYLFNRILRYHTPVNFNEERTLLGKQWRFKYSNKPKTKHKDVPSKILELKELYDTGALTAEEFTAAKAKICARGNLLATRLGGSV